MSQVNYTSNVIDTRIDYKCLKSYHDSKDPLLLFRLVGYLEEEAVKTYTHILEEIDAGRLPMWKNLPAPDIAVTYWQLPEGHTMRDVILAIRADEAHHRDVNHVLASMKLRDKNPFKAGE